MAQILNAREPSRWSLGKPIAQIIRLIRKGSEGDHGAVKNKIHKLKKQISLQSSVGSQSKRLHGVAALSTAKTSQKLTKKAEIQTKLAVGSEQLAVKNKIGKLGIRLCGLT